MSSPRRPFGLSHEVVVIGNRPAGELYSNARILQVIRAVDCAAGQRGPGAAGFDRCEYTAVAGPRGHCHRGRRNRRRSPHPAGMVRLQRP